jgi:phosphoribosylformylglycinamidine synthase subunit PurQ / glutaminase
MEKKGMLAFRYVDATGQLTPDYPVNPNGSERNVAAVTNEAGNVMAMMPHPERVEAGDAIFQSIGDYLADFDRVAFEWGTLDEPARSSHEDEIDTGELEDDAEHLPVKLIITDNTACSIEDALEKKGFHVKVDRWVLWSVESEAPLSMNQRQELISSGELLNTNKEWIDSMERVRESAENRLVLLVDSPVNPLPQMKLQTLRRRLGMRHLSGLRMRTIWSVQSKDGARVDWKALLKTHIFHNPVTDSALRLS